MGADYYESAEQIAQQPGQGIPLIGIDKRCRIEKAIIDKNVRIGDDVVLVNKEGLAFLDADNFYIRDHIIVMPKNAIIPSGLTI